MFLVLSCRFFLGFLLRLFFGWVSSLIFAFLSCCRYVLLSFTPSLLLRSFLPWFVVFFQLCFFSDCSGASVFFDDYFSCFFPLSLSLCVSSFSCSLFFSSLFTFLSLLVLQFPYPGFPFASCCGYVFCLPVDEIKFLVPLFIVVGLLLFSFYYLVRFPSLSAGSESLGGGGGGGGPLTLHRFVWVSS